MLFNGYNLRVLSYVYNGDGNNDDVIIIYVQQHTHLKWAKVYDN